jgi:hypothetical protein
MFLLIFYFYHLMNFLFHGVNEHVHIFLHFALFITLKKFVMSVCVPCVEADQMFGRQQAITLFPGAVCLPLEAYFQSVTPEPVNIF